MNRQKTFYYGGSYVPLGLDRHIPMTEWEGGMQEMQRLGINAFRAFVAWNRIERKEGQLDFTELDYSMELAEKYGLKVVLNIGGMFNNLQGFRPPSWLHYTYHCTPRLDSPDKHPDGRELMLCPDDPVLQKKSMEFIRKTAQRYRSSPALESWSVWNEPHGDPCYCPWTLKAFRNWLRRKYVSLDQLNERWSSVFPVDFPTWEDVRPFSDFSPYAHADPCMKLDFLDFLEDNFIEKFNGIAELLCQCDPKHPTTFNLQGIHAHDMDRFKVDIPGISAYIELDHWTPREQNTWLNLYLRSARTGREESEKIRIIETDSGARPFEGRPGCPKLAAARDWTFVAHGADMILPWIYRTRITGGHALQASMTRWDGSTPPRLEAAAERARIIMKHQDRLLGNAPFAGRCGVYHDPKMYRYALVERWHAPFDFTTASHDGAFMMLQDAGYAPEFVNDAMVTDGRFSRFPALILPFMPYMTQNIADALKKYVRKGGILIAESLFAVKDENMEQFWRKTPGCGLDQVFGFQCADMQYLNPENGKIILQDGTEIPAGYFKMCLEPSGKTEVLGTFEDGAPAVLSARFGKGRVVFFGSMISGGYSYQSRKLREFIRALLCESGVSPLFTIQSTEDTDTLGVYFSSKDGKTLDIASLINYSDRTIRFSVLPDSLLLDGEVRYQDILTGQYYHDLNNMTLEGYQSKILFRES